MHTKYR